MDIYLELQKNEEYLKAKFNTPDLIMKDIIIASKINAKLFYIVGLNDINFINKFIIEPLITAENLENSNIFNTIKNQIISFSEVEPENAFNKIIDDLLIGKAILFIEGESQCLMFGVEKYNHRTLQEPPTSAVLKGPRVGFVEDIKINISLTRKILATPDLETIYLSVGKYTKTQVCVLYISSIAEKSIADKVIDKIKKINIDGIIDSNNITQFLEERQSSMFKQVGTSEKPDEFSAKILEGRIGVIVDGSPICLTLPFLLIEDLQSGDDYYSNHARATFLRWLRVFSCFFSVMLPGMYIAVELHHYKAIPLKFLRTLINVTQNLPLTPFAEILFVLLLFEILYEASLRMPRYLGLALSIVGALILGDTAVKAGLVSPPAVMIVALSGITLYTIPQQSPQLSILRLLFTFAGGCLGFYGIVLLSLFFLFYFNDFDCYSTPYLAPLSPFIKDDFKDALSKQDLVKLKKRPKSIPNTNKIRLKK